MSDHDLNEAIRILLDHQVNYLDDPFVVWPKQLQDQLTTLLEEQLRRL